jgi:hypothetical protein
MTWGSHLDEALLKQDFNHLLEDWEETGVMDSNTFLQKRHHVFLMSHRTA